MGMHHFEQLTRVSDLPAVAAQHQCLEFVRLVGLLPLERDQHRLRVCLDQIAAPRTAAAADGRVLLLICLLGRLYTWDVEYAVVRVELKFAWRRLIDFHHGRFLRLLLLFDLT